MHCLKNKLSWKNVILLLFLLMKMLISNMSYKKHLVSTFRSVLTNGWSILNLDLYTNLRKYKIIYLNFIATTYFWHNAFVEHIDNWTRLYSLVSILYRFFQKICYNKCTCGQFESRKTNVVLFFLWNSVQISSKQVFIITYYLC